MPLMRAINFSFKYYERPWNKIGQSCCPYFDTFVCFFAVAFSITMDTNIGENFWII